ncbi:MAG: poly-gamma-glutamate system protein [Desulfobacterales bacterium]|nr:poly-gamma-glutamate system protein [Desulfobacterales bacterium]
MTGKPGAALVGLTLVLLLLWYFPKGKGFSPDEQALWQRVRSAQGELVRYRQKTGCVSPNKIDPWGSGMMGIEWSPITTTEGDLQAKRTACDPVWAVQFQRWFKGLGLKKGDRVAIYSSSSFPGMLINAVMAAESMELDISLGLSLGASTWGANHPQFPLPVMYNVLKNRKYLHTSVAFFTLGGTRETGMGMPEEGKSILYRTAWMEHAPFLTAGSLADMVALKIHRLEESKARLLISIGGSHANMGNDEGILELSPGLTRHAPAGRYGDGVIGFALSNQIPVIHILNLKGLCRSLGLPYDRAPEAQNFGTAGVWGCVLGLALFAIALIRHQRWSLMDE